jgi:hypothetical protein
MPTTIGAVMRDDKAKLVGTWKLASCVMEDVETGEQRPVWGEHPNGYLVLTSSRWIVVQTAEGRTVANTDAERSAAFGSMLAYSGKYRVEGDKVVIKVDIAGDEAWNGREQVRFWRIEAGRLHIEVAPQPYANFGGRVMRATLIWAREE